MKQFDELIGRLDAAGRALEPAAPQDVVGQDAIRRVRREIASLIGLVAQVNWLAENTE